MKRAYYELIAFQGTAAAAVVGAVMAGAVPVSDVLFTMYVVFVLVSGCIWACTEPPKEKRKDVQAIVCDKLLAENAATIVDLAGEGTEWKATMKGRDHEEI